MTRTIALFRYQLVGIINRKMLLILGGFYLAALLLSLFIAELAIINSVAIAFGIFAEVTRYALVFYIILTISHLVSQDYELGLFERLLAMPVSRAHYIAALFLVSVVCCLLFVTPLFLMLLWLGDVGQAGYWSAAVGFELLLVAQFVVLMTVSLEKMPVAVVLTLAFYLLSRSVPLLELMVDNSASYYNEEAGFQFSSLVLSLIGYILPGWQAFAQTNLLIDEQPKSIVLFQQLVPVAIYSLFLQAVILFDFYRKEFNRRT